jgi:thiamine transport system substrate-binding protein
MHWKTKLMIFAVTVLILGVGYASYVYLSSSSSAQQTLTIYTYSSLFENAPNVSAVNQSVFGQFERVYHVKINLVRISGTENMLQTLIRQKNNPQADLVIGLSNLEAPQAIAAGILLNYTPPNLKYVPSFLVKDLDPSHRLIPYEYSPITIDYCNVSQQLASNLSFQTFENPEIARELVVENPSIDSTGLSFLLYEITFYEYVLHEDWRSWWKSVAPYVDVTATWDSAFTIFPSDSHNFVVSYGTDPAYFEYFGGYSTCGTAAIHYNGKVYTWLEIEGMGIINGTKHLALAEEFENWFLSEAVQSQIPEAEWMFPANSQVALPSVFSSALGASGTVVLNDFVNNTQVAQNLTQWIEEWQTIMSSY